MKSVKNVYEQQYTTYRFKGIWNTVFGEPETNGAWLIWGSEKNGKTWFALMLAKMISGLVRTLYISAEEGLGKNFRDAMKRAGIDDSDRNLRLMEYLPLEHLEELLEKRRAPKVILIDNITVYNETLMYGKFHDLLRKNDDKIFIFLAHEENKQPYTSTAKMCRRLAKVIVHVKGLKAFVSGRCPGGAIEITSDKAQLCWGVQK